MKNKIPNPYFLNLNLEYILLKACKGFNINAEFSGYIINIEALTTFFSRDTFLLSYL